MSFCEQLRKRREELGLSRAELAERLGVSLSAVGNYETGVSAPKEGVLLRLFDALEVDPNYLYRGSFRSGGGSCSDEELHLLEKYRRLPLTGRQTVHTLVDALGVMVEEEHRLRPLQERRTIPLYQSPAAAGFAAPVFGEDYTLIPVEGDVPTGLQNGDVGIFCVDGDMLCKQYCRDGFGMVYLFSLNRNRADMDVVFHRGSGRSLTCFGRVMIHALPLPEQHM